MPNSRILLLTWITMAIRPGIFLREVVLFGDTKNQPDCVAHNLDS